jgi:hypothetical protein
MSPYEHFFWGFAFFHRKPWAWKVAMGSVFPDLIYMVGFIPRMFSYGSFLEWMQDPLWDTIWNSLIAKSVHSLGICGAFLILCFIIFKRKTFRHVCPFLLGWVPVPRACLLLGKGFPCERVFLDQSLPHGGPFSAMDWIKGETVLPEEEVELNSIS